MNLVEVLEHLIETETLMRHPMSLLSTKIPSRTNAQTIDHLAWNAHQARAAIIKNATQLPKISASIWLLLCRIETKCLPLKNNRLRRVRMLWVPLWGKKGDLRLMAHLLSIVSQTLVRAIKANIATKRLKSRRLRAQKGRKQVVRQETKNSGVIESREVLWVIKLITQLLQPKIWLTMDEGIATEVQAIITNKR